MKSTSILGALSAVLIILAAGAAEARHAAVHAPTSGIHSSTRSRCRRAEPRARPPARVGGRRFLKTLVGFAPSAVDGAFTS